MRESHQRYSAIFEAIKSGGWSVDEAARDLGLSVRQTSRIFRRYCEEGPGGLEHRNRGRPSNRAFPEGFREAVLEEYRRDYPGMGPTEFSKLLSDRGSRIDHETLRRWLVEEGLWKGNRGGGQRKTARGSEAGFGSCLSLVSIHDRWLGDSRPACCLTVLRDDATGAYIESMGGEFSSVAAMRLLWAWIERHGIPVALECRLRLIRDDRIRPTMEQQVLGEDPRTAFAEACGRLGIELRTLNPAKGRCIQKRLDPPLADLRRRILESGIDTPMGAAELLAARRAAEDDREIAAAIQGHPDFHVPILDGTDLRNVFCLRSDSVVLAAPSPRGLDSHRLIARKRSWRADVRRQTIVQWLDGSIHVFLDGKECDQSPLTPSRVRVPSPIPIGIGRARLASAPA